MSKKGISPLIATVLILAFTVALAATIMRWGTTFTKSLTESTSETSSISLACASDVDLNVKGVCRDTASGGLYKVRIVNNGRADISKLNVRLYRADDTIESDEILDAIESFGGKAAMTQKQHSNVWKIELIPSIKVDNKDAVCSSIIIGYGDDISNIFGSC